MCTGVTAPRRRYDPTRSGGWVVAIQTQTAPRSSLADSRTLTRPTLGQFLVPAQVARLDDTAHTLLDSCVLGVDVQTLEHIQNRHDLTDVALAVGDIPRVERAL